MARPSHSYGPTCRLAPNVDSSSKADDSQPPVRTQFFYASALPIDDPLSVVPTPSSDPRAAKHAPRPFSPFDNNALEEAWLAFGPARLKTRPRKSSISPKKPLADTANAANGQKGSSVVDEGQGRSGVHSQPDDEDHKRPRTAASRESISVLTDEQTPGDTGSTIPSSLGASEAGTTGFPFQRAPERTENLRPLATAVSPEPSSPPAAFTPLEEDNSNRETEQLGPTAPRDDTVPEDNETADAFRCESKEYAKETASIPVGISRLHLVELPTLQMKPIYWSPVHDVAAVTRATWFYRDTMYPVESAVANQLEMGYRELRPWSRTWSDELSSALALGADGEEKISHRLWPGEEEPSEVAQPHSATAPNNPRCAAMCFNGEVAAEGDAYLVESDEKSPAKTNAPRRYPNSHVIFKDSRNAYILKPSLQPSAYYGRKPLSKIRKGITVGLHIVRGFDWVAWEKLHPNHKSAVASMAEETAPVSETTRTSQRAVCEACAAQPERPAVTDLVLVIHGIGQKLSERVESFHFTHAINSFRRSINVELANEGVQTVLRPDLGGIMVLPVNWRSNLSFEEGGPMKASDKDRESLHTKFSLKDITPDTIPTIRNLISDVMLDIPFYMSHHKPKMIEALVYEANRVYRLWCENNEGFHKNGRVHIIAHSLGSAMALDVLSRQPTVPQEVVPSNASSVSKHFDFDTKNLFFVGSPAGFFLLLERGKLVPRKGRKKPGAGSDGQDESITSDADNFGCLAVDNLYNVMHCNDPIAYRLNATVDPAYALSLKNAQVPFATAGFFGSIGNTMKSLMPGASSTPDLGVGQVAKPVMPRLPSQLEMEVHDFTREEIAEKKFFLLNDNGQIDYFLSSGGGPLEIQPKAGEAAYVAKYEGSKEDTEDSKSVVASVCVQPYDSCLIAAPMAKKVRQRISYVLPLANSPGGHRLGVNGLAVDGEHSILYSGGRDGAICAWDLDLNLKRSSNGLTDPFESPEDPKEDTSSKHTPKTTFRAQTQAHTHWVNDIVLAQNNTALVSASSDLTVRVWRPLSNDSEAPQTIGQHTDYVKCLATPNNQSDWVASGGLDRKICLWDLNGAGKKLEIEISGEEKSEKGSVYALSVSRSMLASGGPESIVRLWDPRSGQRITKFVGHTDNVRSILINESGDTIMTASSDQTVKVWSVTAGRCMHTLTMHNDSVWTLFSDDPELGTFYSADRSGLIVKTDVRNTSGEMDDGISLAVAQETDGVNKVIAYGDHIWTATASSSINRWANVDTGESVQLPEAFKHRRTSSAASRQRPASPPTATANGKKEIPLRSILRISNTASFPVAAAREADAMAASIASLKQGVEILDPDVVLIEPIHGLPAETIEGQHGLVKHKLMNDRRRVLTLDTAGDVLLWDLLQCVPIQSFGKRHLEDVEPEVNTNEAIAPWCSIDTRTGRLAVVLEEYNCFDAEMYADEIQMGEPITHREDQRINLGKWVLRHIFSRLIDEVIRRDEDLRKELTAKAKASRPRNPPPTGLQIPTGNPFASGDSDVSTPRGNGHHVQGTPNMGIVVATPLVPNSLPSVSEDGSKLEKLQSQISHSSGDKTGDYFTSAPLASSETKPAATPNETQEAPKATPDPEKHTNGKETGSKFGKKFKMSFGSKKVARSTSTSAEKPVVEVEKSEGSETSEPAEKETDDSFAGVIQKINADYEKHLSEFPDQPLASGITPSLPNEAPVLKPPPMTTVIIQEETSGGSADLYRGTVGTVGEDASAIVEKAPTWLGELLLRNRIPFKEPVKLSFILQPWQDLLPGIAGPDGNCRLNANRMLRVKKILAYVAERIEAIPDQADPNALKPEEYLELYCYDQKLPVTMTLATLRARIWKGGADVMLYYKTNGRKELKLDKGPEPVEAPEATPVVAPEEP
ncbi:hypothetical protein V494_04161 [Pseudogymnoascus sp. VKM F-4513 (FW-928)]|nr:hypothetical protein V494_04161 [Pseudogymnoascus sp. VKM F-4513 (FW-928)]